MPFSSGVYTLPNPALVTGEVVSATENNTTRNDLAGALNLTMLRNGTSTATANLPMGGYKLTGLGAATTNGDALSYGAAAVVTTLTSTSLTATRVPYAGTGGLLQDASTFTFDGTTLTAGGFTTSGAISAGTITASGNITVSGGTANGVAYLNGSKVLTTGSALTFDGTKLGVGTASPSQKLDLVSSSGSESYARMSDGTIAFLAGVQPALSGALIGTTSSHPVIFYGYGSEQMRLTSTGLGIGTSSPSSKLDARLSGTSSGAVIQVGNTGSGPFGGLGVSDGGSYPVQMWGSALAFLTGNSAYASATEKMRLDSSGNLGLGVTPSAWLSGGNLQMPNGGSITSAGSISYSLANAYYSATGWKYITTAASSYYSQNAGQHQWYTAPSGTAGNAISFTQAMTLDASGNLGVGISSPSTKGHFYNSGSTDTRITVGNGNASLQLGVETTGVGFFGTYQAQPIYFYTNGAEAMRIDSSGNLLVGTTSNAYMSRGLKVSGNTSTGADYTLLCDYANSTESFGLRNDGYFRSTATYNRTTASAANVVVDGNQFLVRSTSALKYKKDVRDIENVDINKFRPVRYKSKCESDDQTIDHFGIIADEVDAAGIKELVTYGANGEIEGFQYERLTVVLVKAIQELKAELDATKAEVAALKGN